ncbi:3'(2'),5'-bisphosphate nucleotidase CysQ [Bartonella sp. DGB2]|uniref:3'(2'),5'-bisphosphate nucleotidase CysQ n=1 Tax=Bartonella sp. DGB2 TaxID=3388426 RepID=UPI00398FE69B
MPENKDDLALLSRVCRQAGDIALRYFRQDVEIWIKAGNSPVSEADLVIDRFLKQELLAARSDYGWISEETVDERPRRFYQRYFMVDPIDGTRGFLEHKSEWCISVAVMEAGRPVVGVLYCPVSGTLYSASLGDGAFLNGERMATLPRGLERKPVISLASSMRGSFSSQWIEKIECAPYVPSLACRIAFVAENRFDFLWVRPNCHDWDIAAAALILHECGGALSALEKQEDGALTLRAITYGLPPYRHGFLLGCGNFQQELGVALVQAAALV